MGKPALEAVCPLVTVVVPVYAGFRTLPELLLRCSRLRDGTADVPKGLLHELIFICDEPVDGSESFLIEEVKQGFLNKARSTAAQ
jgi:hypothetical protein